MVRVVRVRSLSTRSVGTDNPLATVLATSQTIKAQTALPGQTLEGCFYSQFVKTIRVRVAIHAHTSKLVPTFKPIIPLEFRQRVADLANP